jgi:phage replication-related protein YjqB (UPF0714/DUF867 family)
VTPLYPQKLALTSPTGGGRSVGMVRSRTKATEFSFYISGLKAFNHLPLHIKSLANDMKSFKTSLKRFLYHHSFYTIEEYCEYNDDKGM